MKKLFPSLPEEPKLADVFRRFPAAIGPLLEYHDRVLRDENPLGIGERELIAAYVSSLNACRFCLGGHIVFARAHGIEADVIAALLDDVESDVVDEKLRPVLKYVRKLTLEPAKLVEADAEAVYAAGWTEEALFAAVQTCALFNLMNRIVEGTGVTPFADNDEEDDRPAEDLPRMDSYLAFGKRIGVT